jgi:hypothetical protein
MTDSALIWHTQTEPVTWAVSLHVSYIGRRCLLCMQHTQLTHLFSTCVSGLNSTPNPLSNNPVCHQEDIQVPSSIPETSNNN